MEALLHQPRNPARVIEMSMRENDGVNLLRGDRQILPVALAPLLLPLEQATVDQYLHARAARALCVNEMFRSGYNFSCAQKLNVAQACLAVRNRRLYPSHAVDASVPFAEALSA